METAAISSKALPLAQQWLYSGCGIHSLLMVYGLARGTTRPLPSCAALAILNLVYAVASTSWLLYECFRVLSFVCLPLTCLAVSPFAARILRHLTRRILRQLNFTQHKIAYFHPPALRIDTEVQGLFVVRGLTFDPSTLAIEAHGIEVAVQILERMQLSLYVNSVVVNLTRSIEIGEVFGTLKDETEETLFPDSDRKGSPPTSSRPQKVVSKNDAEAQQHYDDLYQDISASSPVNKIGHRIRDEGQGPDHDLTTEAMRAAICGGLVGEPAVPHSPEKEIRVTTLQKLLPRWLARFLARLPFLLRLLLMPLSFLHPITIRSVSVAVPGHWLSETLQQRVLDHYMKDNDSSRDLQQRVNEWLKEAMFCLDFTRISAHGQVPLRTIHDIIAEFRCATTTVFRTAPDAVGSVMTMSGAALEFVIPSYLLPHHEHLVPDTRTKREDADFIGPNARKDSQQEEKEPQDEHLLPEEDQAEIVMRIHGTLPATTDHSLLEFFVEVANTFDIDAMKPEDDGGNAQDQEAADQHAEGEAEKPGLRDRAKRAMRNHVKDRGKQLAKRGLGDDQSEWVKTMVRNVATHFERMPGEVGYSGGIPVPLQPYRASNELPPKLWP